MAVILVLKGVLNPHEHEKTRNSILIIIMDKASDEHITGTLGVNLWERSRRRI